MSSSAQVKMPDRFTLNRFGWCYNDLTISLDEGWCDKPYEYTARQSLYSNFASHRPYVIGFGYSIAEAVKALNAWLRQMGISQYSLEGLPDDHDTTQVNGDYISAWGAMHRCRSERDLESKDLFGRVYPYSIQQHDMVRRDMETLFASKRRVKKEMPEKRTFTIKRTKNGNPALWIVDDFPPTGDEVYLLTAMSGDLTSAFLYSIKPHESDLLTRMLLVAVRAGDVILTEESVENAQYRWDHYALQIYRVVDIQEKEVVCRREFLSSALLPEELRDRIDIP